jgi:hypothetical protein
LFSCVSQTQDPEIFVSEPGLDFPQAPALGFWESKNNYGKQKAAARRVEKEGPRVPEAESEVLEGLQHCELGDPPDAHDYPGDPALDLEKKFLTIKVHCSVLG